MAKVSWFDLDHGLIHAQNMPEEGYGLKDEENRTIDMSDAFRAFLIDYLKNRKSREFVLRPEKAQGTWKYRYDFSRMVEGHFENVGVRCSIDVTPSPATTDEFSGYCDFVTEFEIPDGFAGCYAIRIMGVPRRSERKRLLGHIWHRNPEGMPITKARKLS